MSIIIWFMMVLVPLLLGVGGLRILYGKRFYIDMSLSEIYLTGILITIGLAFGVHIASLFLGWGFSEFVRWFGIGILAAVVFMGLLVGLLVGLAAYRGKGFSVRGSEAKKIIPWKAFWRLHKHPNKNKVTYTALQKVVFVVFGLLVLAQIVVLVTGGEWNREGDMTLETVNTFLAADRIWEVNPLTGQVYSEGVPIRIQILALPSLYGALCKISGVSVAQLVGQWIPVVVLLCGYFVYSRLACLLFGENITGKGIFLLVVALLLWTGTYIDVMDGFGIMFAGYRGTTIRNLVLVPFTINSCLQGKWKLAALCVLAEACIVWTLYGLGFCLLIVVLFLGIHLDARFLRRE